ncbi:hypothetical protein DFH09DRAFT_1257012 [Mycena vulgaris]|nr:hypothetical protein DFH09DRAFT_1257012 [Mycena vulgaris]
MPPSIPKPSHRHGAPSGPWPFLDLDGEIDLDKLESPQRNLKPTAEQEHGSQYPQSLYPNWSRAQQETSGIAKVLNYPSPRRCTIYCVRVGENGTFSRETDFVATEDNKEEYWENLQKEVPNEVRLQAFFLDHLSGPVLQILGTKFNIEPFFFSSSLKWIPSRYQEAAEAAEEGDHITVTLTFIRCMKKMPTTMPPLVYRASQVINTQAPLNLSNGHLLLHDIFAIHMVRSPALSTLISYHPPDRHWATEASTLRTRLLAAGQSVYWNKIFTSTMSSDPTFVLLALLWYPLYAFDEALDSLYVHICELESQVIGSKDIMKLTQDLHLVRAHLLHYASMLEEFRKSVKFVKDTPIPMSQPRSDPHSAEVKDRMWQESTRLLNEIERLEQNRGMQDSRLKNVMKLAFSIVNLRDSQEMQKLTKAAVKDSKEMQKLTKAAVRDSKAMKQISYLTMFFLPASFAATVFGMNVKTFVSESKGTLIHYAAFAVPVTVITILLIMAFHWCPDSYIENETPVDDEGTINDEPSSSTWVKGRYTTYLH